MFIYEKRHCVALVLLGDALGGSDDGGVQV